MRQAVKNRPVKPFDTELKLPEWQLEPDDEQMTGSPEDYYYTDDNGNLIQPGAGRRGGPGEGSTRYEDGRVGPDDESADDDRSPPAAGGEFLDQATGRRSDPDLRAAPPPPGVSRGRRETQQEEFREY
jgi:penicillin-binding protein 1A